MLQNGKVVVLQSNHQSMFEFSFQNLNTSCFVMQPEEMLPDGTPCKTGFCNKGVCEPTMTDIVVRIWGFFEDFNLGSVMRFLKVQKNFHIFC